jgi:hypothetical protein
LDETKPPESEKKLERKESVEVEEDDYDAEAEENPIDKSQGSFNLCFDV